MNSRITRSGDMPDFKLYDSFTSADIVSMKNERIHFLNSIKKGLQKMQEEAILSAIKGNNESLTAVRNARNVSPCFPENIEVIELEKHKMRLYRPKGCGRTETMPLFIYFHGGGWVFGSLNSCAAYCTMMAQRGVCVLAVDYPLAPENKFPAALYKCDEALEFAFDMANAFNVDPARIFIGGDSAGGNLAASVVLLRIMQNRKLPCGIVLYYPVTKACDCTDSECWQIYGNGYGLDSALMSTMIQAYIGTTDPFQPLISPLLAPAEWLSAFPPVLFVGGTCDILYEQSKDFAHRLSEQSVKVRSFFLPEACHLFITVDGQPTARKITADITEKFIYATSFA